MTAMRVLRALATGCLAVWALAGLAQDATGESAGLPGIPEVAAPTEPPTVSVTWYGVTTLLFDDGETKLLIDGFFSRPRFEDLETIAEPDTAQIARMVEVADLEGLAMIAAVHSHFDHAMDVGVLAQATGAVVFGSESTANVARGAGVDESRIVVVDDRREERYGRFSVTMIRSKHLPMEDGCPPIPGNIDAPLVPPAPINAWKEGGSYSVVVAHPAGTAVIQGSAGYVEELLDDVAADVVYLGVGGVDLPGRAHAATYFEEIVRATGAPCARLVHWDDFTRPFGEIVFRGSAEGIAWLKEFAAAGQEAVGKEAVGKEAVGLAALPFGVGVDAFGGCGG